MTPLESLVAACDSLANDARYAAKTRVLAKSLKAWALSKDNDLKLEQ